MRTDWDIQQLSVELQGAAAQEREIILRPLARLIARQLMAGGLAKPEKRDKTIAPERQEATV